MHNLLATFRKKIGENHDHSGDQDMVTFNNLLESQLLTKSKAIVNILKRKLVSNDDNFFFNKILVNIQVTENQLKKLFQ